MTTAPSNPNINAFNTFYNNDGGAGTKGYYWFGETIDDSMTQAPVAPFVAAYQVFSSLDGALSRRATGESWDTMMTAMPTNPNINAYSVFYDSFTSLSSRWNGAAIADTMGNPTAPYVIGLNAFNDGTNYRRLVGSVLSSETTANTTYAPHAKDMLHCYDATSGSWRWVNVIDTQADGQASTLNGMVTSSIGYGYNGTTFDMLRVGASNELQITDVATRPGEDAANDWKKVRIESIATATPAYEDTAAFSALTTILASVEIIGYTNVCFYILNTAGGAAAALSDTLAQVSPDNSNWVSLSWDGCDTLAINTTCVYCISGNAYRYARLRAQTAGATTTTRAWMTANKG
jgi:hypothetical protein